MTGPRRQRQVAEAAPDPTSAIFESMSEGFIVMDSHGLVVSMNAAAERMVGRSRPATLGRRQEDFFGELFGTDMQQHLRRARTECVSVEFESTDSLQARWLANRIAPMPGGGLAVFFQEITDPKRAQLNLALLAAISRDLLLTASEDDMMRTVGARIGAHLQLSHCAFAEIDEAADLAVVSHDWHRPDVAGLVGRYRISELVTEKFLEATRRGEAVVVCDSRSDDRCDPALYTAMQIGAFLSVPLIQAGQWRFQLAVYHSQPHPWQGDEISLIRDVAERIWTRLERMRAEAAVRASERRYRTLLNEAPYGVVLIDAQVRVRAVNPTALPTFAAVAPLIGRDFAEVMHIVWPADRADAFIRIFHHTLASGEAFSAPDDSEVRYDSGVAEYYAWQISRITLPEGGYGVVCYFRDISAQVLAREALAQAEARWRGIFESLHEGFLLGEVVHDESGRAVDWRYLEMNKGWEQITGLSRQATCGKTLREVIPDIEPEWLHDFIAVAQTGTPTNFTRHVAALNRWYEVHAFCPEPGRFAALFLEVTDRHLAQLRQRESEQRLQFVMDSMPQKIFTVRPHGEIDYLNPQWAQFTGLQPDEVRDWGRAGFIHPDDLAETFRIWNYGFASGEPLQIENRFRRADGQYRWHINRLRPLRDANGQISMWVGSSTDIHEQKAAAAALQALTDALTAADRRKTEFLATLAHELRNPLAPISNALHTLHALQRNGVQSAALGSTLKMMSRQVAQLVRLVDDLLDVSRLTQGRIELRLERLDLNAVLEQAAETSEPTLQADHHGLTLTCPPEPLWLDADPVRLVQIFGNLLNNAVKYGLSGGQISVTASREGEGEWARVSVKDNGIGIAPDKIGSIFDMFSQVDPSLERARGGLGIGLMLVQKLVELHGGTVTAHSGGLGQGSEFVVRLPLALDEPLVVLGPPGLQSAFATKVRRVLVVDDSVDAAQTLSELLGVLGVENRVAFGGLQGLREAEAFRPDLVLLDIGMPGMSGYEVARRLRAQSWGQSMRLVALTGWGQSEDRARTREAGFDHHLVKPLDFDALMQVLGEFATLPEQPAQPLEEC